MFSKMIKFKDFSGEEQHYEFYFHIGKAELLELGIAHVHGRLERIKNTNDGAAVLKEVRELVRMAAGMRSDDGKRFLKTEEAKSALFDSNAWDELLFELCTDAESAAEFVNKLFPQELQEEMLKHMRKNPEAEKANAMVTVEATVLKEDPRPAWVREKRKPTRAELMRMPREEMLDAFRAHPGLATEKLTDA